MSLTDSDPFLSQNLNSNMSSSSQMYSYTPTQGQAYPQMMPRIPPNFKSTAISNPNVWIDCSILNTSHFYRLMRLFDRLFVSCRQIIPLFPFGAKFTYINLIKGQVYLIKRIIYEFSLSHLKDMG